MKNNKIKFILNAGALLSAVAVWFLMLLPLQTLAQTPPIPPSVAAAQSTTDRCNNFKNQFTLSPSSSSSGGTNIISAPVYCSASQLILVVINYLMEFSGVITILFLIIGGFMYVTSAGNEEQSEKGKKILVNAVIGLVVITMSYAIVRIVGATLAGK
jgi:hypothetical protein